MCAVKLSDLACTCCQQPTWQLYSDIERYVSERLSRDITLKEVAYRFAYSPNYFGVLFRNQVGVSFNDFLVDLRMKRAKEMLATQRFKIYEVADLVGYKSLTYFTRIFKKAYGMTPGDYKKLG
jgi:Response regulator containing CheY-like receiver domain and AraC-type DNA-binding domain